MSKFEASKTEGVHHQLARMAGTWEGITRVYFDESGTPADESPVTATIKPILDGRFMLHEYKGSFGGKPLEGIAIYGYNMAAGEFECAWADSFHMSTGIMFSKAGKTDQLFSVLGSYPAGTESWGWRTEIQMPGEDELIIKAVNLKPGDEPAGGVETRYTRR